MNFEEINEKIIKDFAGSTIYERGFDYYENGYVKKLEFEDNKIKAKVQGNYGNYNVKISFEKIDIDASCSCPYEGYPCKHIVAVLLDFKNNINKYKSQGLKKELELDSLNLKISSLSKKELENIVLNAIKKYPDLKKSLIVKFKINKI